MKKNEYSKEELLSKVLEILNKSRFLNTNEIYKQALGIENNEKLSKLIVFLFNFLIIEKTINSDEIKLLETSLEKYYAGVINIGNIYKKKAIHIAEKADRDNIMDIENLFI